ncbi:FecR domain-containing protein [Reichenbachiella sp. MALMAid0571]|uniref:FecR family protein n=1 Tax=Reichenbachiella sp. MALMAid0571 TaxID=3143939 RepID=UPI0032DE996D
MDEDIYDIIAKALSGEKNPDKSKLDEWLNENQSHKTIFNSFRFHWMHHKKLPIISKEKVYKRINNRIKHDEIKVKDIKKPFWEYFGRIAAVLLVATGLVWLVNNYHQTLTKHSSDIVEKINPKGQKSTFMLSDGTIIKLNSASLIKFPSQFDRNKREVILEGEAFFEVKRDVEKPFIVHSGNIETTVLGTSFNIQAIPDHNEIKVAVVSGKVSVKSKNDTLYSKGLQEIYLEPNEIATYSKDQHIINKDRFKLEEITGWKDGVLVLKNANLDQIKLKLEAWYGVNITYANSRTAEGEITANYYNEPIENVLESLAYTLRFEYSMNDKNIEISFLNLKEEAI